VSQGLREVDRVSRKTGMAETEADQVLSNALSLLNASKQAAQDAGLPQDSILVTQADAVFQAAARVQFRETLPNGMGFHQPSRIIEKTVPGFGPMEITLEGDMAISFSRIAGTDDASATLGSARFNFSASPVGGPPMFTGFATHNPFAPSTGNLCLETGDLNCSLNLLVNFTFPVSSTMAIQSTIVDRFTTISTPLVCNCLNLAEVLFVSPFLFPTSTSAFAQGMVPSFADG
jgi:hypothetical protein